MLLLSVEMISQESRERGITGSLSARLVWSTIVVNMNPKNLFSGQACLLRGSPDAGSCRMESPAGEPCEELSNRVLLAGCGV